MLDTAQALIRRGGKILSLTDEEIEELIKINVEHVFEIKLEKTSKSFTAISEIMLV